MHAAIHPGNVESEPYRLPAGLLAVAVHAAFFSLLYFGFSWQTQPPATMSVELWDSLPRAAQPATRKAELPPEPAPEPAPAPAPKAESRPAPPEIAMPDKKAKPVEKTVKKETVKAEPRQPTPEELAAERDAADRAEREAAAGRVVDEYKAKIKNKVKGKVVMPPDVADDAEAVFLVTVLPGGSVLNPRLLKSSGNAVYDNAVERAILKAQPLPLPPDTSLFNRFRELRLTFRPKE